MTKGSTDPAGLILANLPGLLPSLEALYKDVHAHPELSMQETRTADLAARHLRDNGYEVTTGVGKTGVVGLLRNGEGPTVMLRADMDALPVLEPAASTMRAASPRPMPRGMQGLWRMPAAMTCMSPG
jgi:hippurate hydrolase